MKIKINKQYCHNLFIDKQENGNIEFKNLLNFIIILVLLLKIVLWKDYVWSSRNKILNIFFLDLIDFNKANYRFLSVSVREGAIQLIYNGLQYS